jgi:putative ABC transport system permease protein
LSRWTVALRLSRRDALRHRTSSVLTAALVAAPVTALVLAGSLYASANVSSATQDHRNFGNAAFSYSAPSAADSASGPSVATQLPAGSHQVTRHFGSLRVIGPGGHRYFVQTDDLPYADPLVTGIVTQQTGRPASSPSETVLTPTLAHLLQVKVGGKVTVVGGQQLTVVGLARYPADLSATSLVLAPRSKLAGSDSSEFVGLPAGTNRTAFVTRLLNQDSQGQLSVRRADEPPNHTTVSRDALSTGALVVLLALLQAALTAGSAFAVGARRKRRSLALVAVNGGERRDLASIVLADGVVLGLVGTLSGAALGLLLAPVAYPFLQDHTNEQLMGVHFRPWLVVAAIAFGLLAAVLAALVPSRQAARVPLTQALGGLRGATRTPRWLTGLGAALCVIGVLVAMLGATSTSTAGASRTPIVLLGITLLQLGSVCLCPVIVGAAGKLGSHLPVSPRLALRDAARQRARSGPAVAAVAAAVSGAMAVSIFLASSDTRDRQQYVPASPANQVSVTPIDADLLSGPVGTSPANGALQAAVPRGEVERLLQPVNPRVIAREQRLNVSVASPDTGGQGIVIEPGSGSTASVDPSSVSETSDVVMQGDASTLQALGAADPDGRDAKALLAGTALVTSPALLENGMLELIQDSVSPTGKSTVIRLPAQVASWGDGYDMPGVLLSERVVAAHHITAQAAPEWRALLAEAPSAKQAAQLMGAAPDINADISIERGFHPRSHVIVLVLLLVSLLFSLGVTAVATALASADARPDLAVLAAVGAAPATRRRLVAAQAGVTALLGGAIGLVIGLVPAWVIIESPSDLRLPFTMPWQPYPVFLVGLPLVAIVGGLLLTRSRLPVPRRG